MTRFKQFLVSELKVCSEAEAANRIFFISAREMLDLRLKERGVIRHGEISVLYMLEKFKRFSQKCHNKCTESFCNEFLMEKFAEIDFNNQFFDFSLSS